MGSKNKLKRFKENESFKNVIQPSREEVLKGLSLRGEWHSFFENNNPIILELGCGIGLVGIAATFARANVTFSDYENDAINFTKNNFFLNFGKRANTILLDWRNPNHNQQYKIILAADILYEKRFLDPVYNTLNMLLAENG